MEKFKLLAKGPILTDLLVRREPKTVWGGGRGAVGLPRKRQSSGALPTMPSAAFSHCPSSFDRFSCTTFEFFDCGAGTKHSRSVRPRACADHATGNR